MSEDSKFDITAIGPETEICWNVNAGKREQWRETCKEAKKREKRSGNREEMAQGGDNGGGMNK